MIRNIIKAVGLVGEKQFIFFLNSMFDKSVSLNEKMKNLCSLLAALSNIPNAQEELQSLLSSSRIRLVEITAENIDEMSGIYSYIILALGRNNKSKEALEAFEEYKKKIETTGIKVAPKVLNAALSVMINSKQYKEAATCLQQYRDSGASLSSNTVLLGMQALNSVGMPANALDLFDNTPSTQLDCGHYNRAMQSALMMNDAQHAQRIFDKLMNRAVKEEVSQPNKHSYRFGIYAYSLLNNSKMTIALLQRGLDVGLKLDKDLINAICDSADSVEEEANLLPMMAGLLSSNAIPELQHMLHEVDMPKLMGEQQVEMLDDHSEEPRSYSLDFKQEFDVAIELGVDYFE
eukprot:TRINITY_DN2657_c0_g1_i1.p1 TRINITY_DN2657_c0_g1~~TRINITY_DN2657_c0_g1_i1.p1  ORF type:complete len:362 (-),score=97.86 TRINITY_DN2657_c0_g1_i1:89-1129(-)